MRSVPMGGTPLREASKEAQVSRNATTEVGGVGLERRNGHTKDGLRYDFVWDLRPVCALKPP